MVSNTIGAKLGPETIVREYKTFTVKTGIMSSEVINNIVRSKSFNKTVDKSIKNSIEKYLQYYLGKYAACMSRTAVSVPYAKLYIGVDDDGTVTGIPFKGVLTEDSIKFITDKYIETNIRGVRDGLESNEVKKLYVDKIKLTVKKLNLSHHVKAKYCDSIKRLLAQIDKDEIKWEINMGHYLKKMEAWRAKLQKYDVKLQTVANDKVLRKEFLAYCVDRNAHKNVINLLRSDTTIRIHLGVGERKINKNSFDFWVTDFKEYMMDQVLSSRPNKPCEARPHGNLFHIFNCMSPLIGWWNEDISYYLIEIDLPTNINPHEWLEYFDRNKWVSYVRCENYNVPCCMRV